MSRGDWAEDRLTRLEVLLRQQDYKGWDPFDLPNSPLLARIPAGWQLPQLVLSKAGARLLPDAGRRLLRVPHIEDPKIYACAYFGYRYGGLDGFRERAETMVDRLAALARPQTGGRRAWGYDYTWATRSSGVNPRGASTIVPGSFAALTLLHHARDTGSDRHLGVLEEALGHYAERHASQGPAGPFMGYFAGSAVNTHNANLLGCAALTLGGLRFGREDWLELAARSATTTVRAVRQDGYLAYADHSSGEWTDCFHHLYAITCARAVASHNPAADAGLFAERLEQMWAYTQREFLREDGLVNYFPSRLHPIDPHNYAATAIYSVLTPGALPDGFAIDLLRRVDALMWEPRRGRYAFRRGPRRTDRRTFLRWTQAWMFAALALARSGARVHAPDSVEVGA